MNTVRENFLSSLDDYIRKDPIVIGEILSRIGRLWGMYLETVKHNRESDHLYALDGLLWAALSVKRPTRGQAKAIVTAFYKLPISMRGQYEREISNLVNKFDFITEEE